MFSVDEVLSARGEAVHVTGGDSVASTFVASTFGLKCGEASLLRRCLDKTVGKVGDCALSTGTGLVTSMWGDDVRTTGRSDPVFSEKVNAAVMVLSADGVVRVLLLDLDFTTESVAVFSTKGDFVRSNVERFSSFCNCGVAELLRVDLDLTDGDNNAAAGSDMFP